MREAQDHTYSRCSSLGTPCRDIAAAHDDYMRKHGLKPEARLYCHGQGYDLVERPLVRADETMKASRKNMNFAVHPGNETGSLFAVICDNYLIGADGPSDSPAPDTQAGVLKSSAERCRKNRRHARPLDTGCRMKP